MTILSLAIKHLLLILILSILVFFVCACTYQGDEFTFSAPFGFKTELFETPQVNPGKDSETVLFSKNGHLSFWITRHKIPAQSDLEKVIEEYKTQPTQISLKYQFISENKIEINDRSAIEYVYRQFSGESYWQRREIWMENKGWAYGLVCSDPAESTPGKIIPVSELCIRLAEGFTFK